MYTKTVSSPVGDLVLVSDGEYLILEYHILS